MASKKSRVNPTISGTPVPLRGPSLYTDFFVHGIAHCLTCKATGRVAKSNESGVSSRVIEWSHGEVQLWDHFSAPSICDRCWIAKRRAQGKPV